MAVKILLWQFHCLAKNPMSSMQSSQIVLLICAIHCLLFVEGENNLPVNRNLIELMAEMGNSSAEGNEVARQSQRESLQFNIERK